MGWIRLTRLSNGAYWLAAIAAICIALVAQFGTILVFILLSKDPPSWLFAAQAFVIPVVIPCFVASFRHRWAFTAKLRESDGRVCTTCGYPLNAEHDGKPCPECGTPIDLAHCRKTWLKHVGGW